MENDEQLIALSDLALGQKGLLTAFSFDVQDGEKILKMGLTPGEQIEIVRRLPQENTVEVKIRGYFVSLSMDEARRILVKLSS